MAIYGFVKSAKAKAAAAEADIRAFAEAKGLGEVAMCYGKTAFPELRPLDRVIMRDTTERWAKGEQALHAILRVLRPQNIKVYALALTDKPMGEDVEALRTLVSDAPKPGGADVEAGEAKTAAAEGEGAPGPEAPEAPEAARFGSEEAPEED